MGLNEDRILLIVFMTEKSNRLLGKRWPSLFWSHTALDNSEGDFQKLSCSVTLHACVQVPEPHKDESRPLLCYWCTQVLWREPKAAVYSTMSNPSKPGPMSFLTWPAKGGLTEQIRISICTKQLKVGSSFLCTLMGFLNVGFHTHPVSCARVCEPAGSLSVTSIRMSLQKLQFSKYSSSTLMVELTLSFRFLAGLVRTIQERSLYNKWGCFLQIKILEPSCFRSVWL